MTSFMQHLYLHFHIIIALWLNILCFVDQASKGLTPECNFVYLNPSLGYVGQFLVFYKDMVDDTLLFLNLQATFAPHTFSLYSSDYKLLNLHASLKTVVYHKLYSINRFHNISAAKTSMACEDTLQFFSHSLQHGLEPYIKFRTICS